MKFSEAFEIVIEKWPATIDISKMQLHENGGATITELTKIHDEIEAQCLDLGREVVAMDWSIFQYLHHRSIQLYKGRQREIFPHDIDQAILKQLFRENLD